MEKVREEINTQQKASKAKKAKLSGPGRVFEVYDDDDDDDDSESEYKARGLQSLSAS